MTVTATRTQQAWQSDETSETLEALDPTRSGGTFSALRSRNYRIYATGQSVSNIGTWMQNVAQDWLVLQLTHSSAAVGITMAAQFLPMLLFGMYGGVLADRLPKRAVLLGTQATAGLLSALLAVITITGAVQAWHVWLIAVLGGVVFVVDNPTRQVFLHDLVSEDELHNAIALNGAIFHSARLIGPALSAGLIGAVGCGWAFAVNAACYLPPLACLLLLRGIAAKPSVPREKGQLRAGLHYVRQSPQVAWTIVLVGIVGTFGLNFPVVLTGMAEDVFGLGAGAYGMFNVVIAAGSVMGALLAARRHRGGLIVIVWGAVGFGLLQAGAGVAPGLILFTAVLLPMGAVNVAFQALANSSVQLAVAPAFRGRVMALYMLVFAGGTPIGAPIIGLITAHAGPRVGMAVCGLVPAAAGLVYVAVMAVQRRRADIPASVTPAAELA